MDNGDQTLLKLVGGCQCGAVRYALASDLETALLCHCRMCQRATGGLFGAYATGPAAAFSWTNGAPRSFQSSDLADRYFCDLCGTPLAFNYRSADVWSVTIGSLDQPALTPIQLHLGVESRIPWVRIDDGLPQIVSDRFRVPGVDLTQITSFQSPESGEILPTKVS